MIDNNIVIIILIVEWKWKYAKACHWRAHKVNHLSLRLNLIQSNSQHPKFASGVKQRLGYVPSSTEVRVPED